MGVTATRHHMPDKFFLAIWFLEVLHLLPSLTKMDERQVQ